MHGPTEPTLNQYDYVSSNVFNYQVIFILNYRAVIVVSDASSLRKICKFTKSLRINCDCALDNPLLCHVCVWLRRP